MGVWMWPGGGRPGDYETFCLDLIPPTDPLLPHVWASLDALPNELRPAKRSKAGFNTWRAWQDGGRGVTTKVAIDQGLLHLDAAPATEFIDWVRRLMAADK